MGNSHVVWVRVNGPIIVSRLPSGSSNPGESKVVVVERNSRWSASTSTDQFRGSRNSTIGPMINRLDPGATMYAEEFISPRKAARPASKSSVRFVPVIPISKLRFDALAGYIRKPSIAFFVEELAWFSHAGGRVLGLLSMDRTDGDFGGIVLGRDGKSRFRCMDVIGFHAQESVAQQQLLETVERWSMRPDADFLQGDERGAPIDFFTPVVGTEKLSDAFVRLPLAEGFSCARVLIEAMMSFYEDVDGNFVEQFQSTGFDARFWELYSFALLTEEGFVLDRSFSAPDFLCEGNIQDIFVEAVTVNPSRSGNVITEPTIPTARDEFQEYLKNYMPLKWGGALTAKLRKEYWNLPHVKDKPIVLSIQDFHAPRAMTMTHSTLEP